MTTKVSTENKPRVGSLLTGYNGQVYDLIDGNTWTIKSVSHEAEVWPMSGETLWYWVEAVRNLKDGTPGKRLGYFRVSPGGSIKPMGVL